MDIRQFFDRFIDTTCFTDEQLMQLFQQEKEKTGLKKIVAFNKKSLLLEVKKWPFSVKTDKH